MKTNKDRQTRAAFLQSPVTSLLLRHGVKDNSTTAAGEFATSKRLGPPEPFEHPSPGLPPTPLSGSRFAHDFSQVPVRSETPFRLQTKLTVSTPGDSYEQEADAIADNVMRMSDHPSAPLSPDQAKAPSRSESLAPDVRPKRNDGEASSDTLSHVNPSSLSDGSQMDGRTQSFMESRFGTDFSRVKIHTDSRAAQMSRELNAQAFAIGNDLFFNEGKYDPQTDSGRRLLAHELAHTLQQRAPTIHRKPQLSTPGADEDALRGKVYKEIEIITETQIPYDLYKQNIGRDHPADEDILVDRKIEAAKRLGELRSPHAVITLVAVLNDRVFAISRLDPDKKSQIVDEAAKSLGLIGGKEAISELTVLLNSADLAKRTTAMRAFKFMKGTAAAAPALVARLNVEPDAEIKNRIVDVLGEMGQDLSAEKDRQSTLDALIKILKGIKPNDQTGALYHTLVALGNLADKRATAPLLETLFRLRSDDSVLITGFNTLGMIGDSQAVPFLDTLLKAASNKAVRIAAAKALGDIGGQKAITSLINRLDSKLEKDPQVIQAIRLAIRNDSG